MILVPQQVIVDLILTVCSGDLTRQGQLLFQVLPEDDGPVEEE